MFAAVYLDQGFNAAKQVVLGLFRGRLEEAIAAGPTKDPKTRLQELLQADRRPLPAYEVLEIGGSQHAQSFLVSCSLTDSGESTEGRGKSRRQAEQQAAERMLVLVRSHA